MALTSCPECEREISSRAAACPHCGCPIQERASVPDRLEAPQTQSASSVDSGQSDAVLRLAQDYLLRIGGGVLAYISLWLLGWGVAGAFFGSLLWPDAAHTSQMDLLSQMGLWIGRVGLLIGGLLVVVSCARSYGIRQLEPDWIDGLFLKAFITLASRGRFDRVEQWRRVAGSLVSLGLACYIALIGVAGLGIAYIGALLVSVISVAVAVMMLFTHKDGATQVDMANRLQEPSLPNYDRRRLPWLDAAILHSPRLASAYYERAVVKEIICRGGGLSGNPPVSAAEVLADLDRAIQLDPGFADAYGLRASVRFDQGLLNEALQDADRAVELAPSNADFHSNRAYYLKQKKDYRQAVESATAAIESQPDDISQYLMRGSLLMDLGDYDAAYQDFSRAINLSSKNDPRWQSECWLWRGNALAAKGDLDGASADYAQVIRFNAGYEDICNRGRLFWSGKALAAKGDHDGAIANFTQVIDQDPYFKKAYQARAEAFREKGQEADAQSDLAKIREIERERVELNAIYE